MKFGVSFSASDSKFPAGFDDFTVLQGKDGETPYIKDGYWWIGDTNTNVKAEGTDGKDGKDGINGTNGKDGINGADGKDGIDGKDGTSVTVVSVKESSEDGGSNTVTFSNGMQLTIKNGEKGSQGAQGLQGEKGEQGIQGERGLQGEQGIQGEKGEKGDKGDTGATGATGKDGISASHSWNGTVLTITSANGTSSADLKGPKGDQGAQGIQGPKGDQGIQGIQGEKGADGAKGADGYTPVKGIDYFTPAEKAEFINSIKSSLSLGIASDGLIYLFVDGVPVGTGIPQGQSGDVFGYVDENNTIVLNGNLADGTYSVKYEMDNGNIVNVGNMVLDSTVYHSVTSNLTNCTNSNSTKTIAEGSSYTATITANSGYELKSLTVTMGGQAVSVSGGNISIASVTGNIVITAVAEVYVPSYTNIFDPSKATLNQRVSSSYAMSACDGHITTDIIDITGKTPFTDATKIYIKGATFNKYVGNGSNYARVMTYKNKPSSGYSGVYSSMYIGSLTITNEGNGVISVSKVAESFPEGVKYVAFVLNVKDTAVTANDIKDIVITIDEPIS